MKDVMLALHQQPIAVYPAYIDMTGSVTAGLLLSQIMYWNSKMKGQKFYKTDAEIMQETRLTQTEFRSAKKRIAQLPFILIVKEGMPARTYYQVDANIWRQEMESICSLEINQQAGRKSTRRFVGNLPTCRAENQQTCTIENQPTIQENTQRLPENTTESVEFVNEPAPLVSENDNLGSIPEPTPIPPVPPAPPPQSKPKKAAFTPPTLEEVKAAFVEVLKKKGSPHPEAWAESEAENFLAYWENQKFKPGKSGNWVLSLRVNTWVGNLNGRIQKAPFGIALKPQGPRVTEPVVDPSSFFSNRPKLGNSAGMSLEEFKQKNGL